MTVLPEIESRFDVIAKLGEGGMGTVYKVRHRDLDEIQIVKTMQAHFTTNEGLRNRFINEARRGMRLRHPHIAGVHDFAVCADGTGYIVMEYVPGINLRDMLATRGPLPLPMIGEIAVQTLDALAYLHNEKFVHRDISPDNLMVQVTEGRPFVKLIDLGISKSLEADQKMTATGQFLGKVQYAAPEAFGGELDGRSDLYSFGVVLYNLLTNADPFPGENYREIISAHLFQPPRPFDPDLHIPEAVQRVVMRALEKDPDKRYADAAEFITAVEAESDEVAPIVRTLPATTIIVPTRPRRWRWAIAAAVAVVIIAAAAFVMWQRAEAARLAAYGKFYAVVIGESNYRHMDALPTAIDDARAVGDLLKSKYGFDVTPLPDATQQQILDAFHAVAKRMTPNDNLLVFYAGHGTIDVTGKGYWRPIDDDLDAVKAISPALMKDTLIDQPSRRTLIIADSCYSGALAQAQPTRSRDKRSRIVISSGGMEPVVDSANGQHSIFTTALLEVLEERRERVVDVQSLFAPIRDKVVDAARRAGHEQKPQLAVLAEVGDEGGSFFFVRR